MSQQNVVTVHIAGEDYNIRAHSTPEHARACAALVDGAVREVIQAMSLVPRERAVILAAMAIAADLLQARAELADTQTGLDDRMARLADEIEAGLAPENLAGAR